jgi:hypothetical protein
MSTNIYQQSTTHLTKNLPKLTREQALKKVAGPALSLIIVSGLILSLIMAAGTYVVYQRTMEMMNPVDEAPAPVSDPNESIEQRRAREKALKQIEVEREFLSFALVSVVALVMVLCNVVVLAGAIRMKQLKSFRFSYTAAAFAVIPLLSPGAVLGIPFGIWALVVIHNKEVRRYFVD